MKNNVIAFSTSKSGEYCKDYRKAALVMISSFIRKNRKNIFLDELYEILSADTKAEKTSIRMAVRDAKDGGLITSTEIRGFYKVN